MVDSHVGDGIDILAGQGFGRKLINCLYKRAMGIRIIYLQIKWLVALLDKLCCILDVIAHVLAAKVGTGDGLKIKREGALGVDVKFTDNAGAVTRLAKGLHHVLYPA